MEDSAGLGGGFAHVFDMHLAVTHRLRGDALTGPTTEAVMPVVSKLIRKVPGLYLRDYFAFRDIVLSKKIDWNAKTAKLRKALTEALEAGQSALKSGATGEQQELLAEIESNHGRAIWMFVHHHDQFRRAEESASFDRARNKNTWDAFVAPIDLTVDRGKAARKGAWRMLGIKEKQNLMIPGL